MNLYIPSNLDLDSIVMSFPPDFKPFKIDKLKYIIHLISVLPLSNKRFKNDEYTLLSSTKLKSKIENYRQYLDYLLKHKIIESNKHYIVGEKPIGYKLNSSYNSTLTPHRAKDKTLIKSSKRDKRKKEESLKDLQHLTKWFNNNLNIDRKRAFEFIKEEYRLNSSYPNIPNLNKETTPLNRFNHSAMYINMFANQEFYLSRDENVFRFHSNLTNMRSVLRNMITYQGKTLVSLDLKNSQPYLSTLLLSKELWQELNLEKKKKTTNKEGEPKIHYNQLILNKIENTIIKGNEKKTAKTTYIMFREISQLIESNNFKRYIDLVINGQFYEYFQAQLTKHFGHEYNSREEAKLAMLKTLFSDNRFIAQKEAKPKRLFKKLFPEVYEVFAEIKRNDKSRLARLLQTIESHIIIDVICNRISREYPEAPIFTIHDSIATTTDFVEVVESIMEEELLNIIGHPPTLKREVWSYEELDTHLEKIKESTLVLN